jgi:hypothetical protein
MVEMIRLADEPWAPVAQGQNGVELGRLSHFFMTPL